MEGRKIHHEEEALLEKCSKPGSGRPKLPCEAQAREGTSAWRNVLRVVSCSALLYLYYVLHTTLAGPSLLKVFFSAPLADPYLEEMPVAPRRWWTCDPIIASTTHQVSFNISTDSATPKRWQLLDESIPEARETFHGSITIEKGYLRQGSDVVVNVLVRSTDETNIGNVVLYSSDSGLVMKYKSSSNSDLCTEVEVVVSLRAESKYSLDELNIQTDILDIFLHPVTNWDIKEFNAHSSYGKLDMEPGAHHDEPMARNVSISSAAGGISGWFVPDQHLHIRNDYGDTTAILASTPKTDGKTWVGPQGINISSISGHIRVGTNSGDWLPKAYTHRTQIRTESGKILARVPHGARTEISSTSGRVVAILQPYGVDCENADNYISTMSQSGGVAVYLFDPDAESLRGYCNPLLNTVSEHEVGEGSLVLTYPRTWYGEIEGHIIHGQLAFDGSELECAEGGRGSVKARRGAKGDSLLNARVGVGALDIRIGLEETP
ncbi:hypothetical protein K458DRAFT_376238 [Lentithecium fluviatile CBS 122367]|uniref:Uncharacterized protein n=1 Tax=Lentithecium fluviatile CBS 122367 TaxID=1168545 RepID=A0A6G1IKY6_9PLEO|nr:hypothetical protein K458DRAFT_376238 [Lentithecium fluviatile CBS 122367]